jgi:hypothetical protein
MLDADNDPPGLDPERVYRRYLETCRRLGVTLTLRDQAKALIKQWTESLAAAARSDPPTTH